MGEASSKRLLWAGSEPSAENVVLPTKRSASGVSTGATCTPASTSRRQTSTALYAPMPPETPRTTRGAGVPSVGLRRRLAGGRAFVLGRLLGGLGFLGGLGEPTLQRAQLGLRALGLGGQRVGVHPGVGGLGRGDLLERDRDRLA